MQTMKRSMKRTPAKRFTNLILIFAFVMMMVAPSTAFADVRKSDIVTGSTVEELGLSVSQCPSVNAEYVCLVDSNGKVYFERNADEETQIASVTKVMTAIVAIENAPLDSYVSVSAKAAEVGESSAGLQEGDTMTLETALKALLVPSGNDAAIAIAESVGARMIAADPSLGTDPEQVFVDAMNEKAAELGCTDTLYENPHGLDDGEYAGNLHSTASDQAKVAQCAMTYDEIRSIVSGGSTTITVTRNGQNATVELEATDEFLDMYEYAIGIKTGLTDSAGACFMGAANNGSIELYAIVLDSTSTTDRFTDTETLFEWAYENFTEVSLAQSSVTTTMDVDGETKEVPVIAKVPLADWQDRTVDATLEDPDATVTVFKLNGNVTQSIELDDIHGGVTAGQKVGTITYYQHNEVVAQQNLVACETVAAPTFFESIATWWNRFIGSFTGESEQADPEIYNVMPIIKNNASTAA